MRPLRNHVKASSVHDARLVSVVGNDLVRVSFGFLHIGVHGPEAQTRVRRFVGDKKIVLGAGGSATASISVSSDVVALILVG